MSDWWSADPVTSSPSSATGGRSNNWWDADPAEQAAAPAARTPSLGGTLLAGFENQGSAAGQRTTPNIAAHAPNLLGPATVTEEGDVGYKDEQGNFQPTDINKHITLMDPADRTYKVYARTPETDEGMLSAAGHLLGTGFGAGGIATGRSALPAATAAGESIGVTVPRAVSGGPLTRLAGQTIAKLPGGGPLYKAYEAGVEDLGKATGTAQEMAGGPASVAEAGGAFRAGTVSTFGKEVPDIVSQYYDKVDRFVNPNVRTELGATRDAVADIMARRANYGKEGMPKAVAEVIDSVQKLGGIDYAGIKDLRSSIGELLQKTPEGMSHSELSRIYGTLSDDLRTAVEAGGGKEGLAAFERANKVASLGKQWEEKIGKVLGSDTRSDEGISDAIRRMASSGAGADIETLFAARRAVPPQAWQKIASNVIGGLGRDRSGNFSPNVFLNDYAGLSDAGKKVLFYSVGKGDLIKHLDAIAEVSQQFKNAAKFANPSGTVSHGAMATGMGVIAHAAFEGEIGQILGVVGTAIGNNLLSRILSHPASAAATARWAKAYTTALYRGDAVAQRSLDAATRSLATTAAPRLGVSADDLIPRITDAALSGQEQPEPQEQLQ